MLIVLYALTAFLYAGSAFPFWRAHRRTIRLTPDIAAGLARAPGAAGAPRGVAGRGAQGSAPFGAFSYRRLMLLAALVAHGVLLHSTVFPPDRMVFGFAFALSAMLWLGAIIYWIESFFFPLDTLTLLVLPLAIIACLLPAVFSGVQVLAYAADPLFKLHFLIANVAYGLLALAALHAMLMLLLERRLHRAHGATPQGAFRVAVSGWLDTLPPLLTLEKILFRLIRAGFAFLTLTLVSGVLFSEQLLDRAIVFDHKTVFAVLSWVMFGALLAGRALYGWRGRAALRWVVASFVALLLAYVGSRFVFEVLLHRPVV